MLADTELKHVLAICVTMRNSKRNRSLLQLSHLAESCSATTGHDPTAAGKGNDKSFETSSNSERRKTAIGFATRAKTVQVSGGPTWEFLGRDDEDTSDTCHRLLSGLNTMIVYGMIDGCIRYSDQGMFGRRIAKAGISHR